MPVATAPQPTAPTDRGPQIDRGTPELGLRERHKRDKLRRIAQAAHMLFARDGYEGTVLREIARDAGVALGTLSLYARDKRDLILLIFNTVIPPLLQQGEHQARRPAPLVTRLTRFFEPFYQAYATDVTLYRIVLGQIYAGADSVHGTETATIRLCLITKLCDMVEQAIQSGDCAADLEVPLAARSLYFLYFAAVRAWLSEADPSPTAGLAELKTLFAQQIRGMQAPNPPGHALHAVHLGELP